jgi:hypothetical protein
MTNIIRQYFPLTTNQHRTSQLSCETEGARGQLIALFSMMVVVEATA